MQGTIAKVVTDKGFGFIKPDGNGEEKDLFFHITGLENRDDFEEFVEGKTKVAFEVDHDHDRPRAQNVRRL